MGKTDGTILRRIDNISYKKISFASFCCCAIWFLSPIYVMFLNLLNIGDYNVCNIWITALYVSGGFGLIIGGIYLYQIITKSQIDRRDIIISLEPLIFLVVFALWCIFCTLFAAEKRIAIYGYTKYRDNLFTYLFYGGMIFNGFVLTNNKKYLLRLVHIYLTVAMTMSVFTLMNNSITERLFDSIYRDTDGFESVFYNVNHYGVYLLFALFGCTVLLFSSGSLFKKALTMALFVLLSITLAETSNVVIIIIVLLLLVGFALASCINKSFLRQHRAFSLLLIVLFVLSVLICSSINELHNALVDAADTQQLTSFVVKIMNNSVVGIGLQNTLAYADNAYLQMALYTGVFGILIMLSVYTVAFKAFFSNGIDNPVVVCAAVCVFAYLLSAFFNSTMFYIAPFYYFIFGIFLRGSICNSFKYSPGETD